MAKRLTPIIGLAVVVALAMVAVFGAMSLTPGSAQAQTTPGPSGLTVTAVTDSSVTVTWTAQDGFEDDHYEVRSYLKVNAASGGFAGDNDSVNSGTVRITPDTADTAANMAVVPTVVASVNEVHVIQVRTSKGTDISDVSNIDATPRAQPNVQYVDIDPDTGGDQQVVATPGTAGGTVKLEWGAETDPATVGETAVADITGWQYLTGASGATWMDISGVSSAVSGTNTRFTATLTQQAAMDTTYQVRGVQGLTVEDPANAAEASVAIMPMEPPLVVPPPSAEKIEEVAMLKFGSRKPGSNTRYDISFITTKAVDTLTDAELVIKMEDFGVPSTISASTVAITVDDSGTTDASAPTSMETNQNRNFIPEDVTVDGDEIIITLGDTLTRDDSKEDFDISIGSTITVVLRQSAGISNPSEYGEYGVNVTLGDKAVDLEWEAEMPDPDDATEMVKKYPGLSFQVPRTVSIDPEDGGLGEMVTVTGKGFKNGTSLIVFIDSPEHVDEDDNPATPSNNDDGDSDTTDPFKIPNGKLDSGEDVLCGVDRIASSDVGKCEFEVTHPTFSGGVNYINAVDGRTGHAGLMGPNNPTMVSWEMTDDGPAIVHDYLAEFVLEASLKATPDSGSPGEIILLQVVDFPPGNIGKIEISRETHCSGSCGNVDSQGSGNISLTIPNTVKAGAQEVRITSGVDSDVKASATVTFVGPQINVTPGTVLANQRVSLVGTGFSPGAVIANASDPDYVVHPSISIGGSTIGGGRINDSDPVRVDNGGNWSASVDLPLKEATTAEGERTIRVADSRGRTGVVVVSIPAREVTVTPEVGRVGTISVVRGEGFPSKNDEGSSFNVQIVYDASNGNTTTVSATPDASGRFEVQLRIPTTAAIPSSNSIKVSFKDTDLVDVVTTVAHDVPEGIITLSETSGGPGSTVSVSGEGFKSFVPVSLVKVGTLDVTPAPKPSTDGNGMMTFDIIIPGLDVGIQTIEVNVGRTTASTGFVVTESGINPGNIKEVGPALEDLGDNFVNIWHFNNDTKSWSFYDGMEGSDLTHLITGETYLMQIKSTIEVILNNDTRNLTCVDGNCWNQIVW